MRMKNAILIGLALVVLAIPAALAIPQELAIQGRLTNSTGGLESSKCWDMNFSIYDALTSGTLLYNETYNSTTACSTTISCTGIQASPLKTSNEGVFNANLGTCNPITLPFDQDYYLEIRVNGSTLTPRHKITSAGYTFRANVTDFLSADAIATKNLSVTENLSVNSGVLFVDGTNDRVGIGGVPLNSKLTVFGDLNVTGASFFGTQSFINISSTGDATFKGNASFADGTAALPSLSFISDTDTGIYKSADNTIGFATQGARRVLITTTQIRGPDGVLSGPGFAFADDALANTGIYRPGEDVVGISAGGTNIANFTTSGLRIFGDLNVSGATSFGTQSFVNISASGDATFSGNVSLADGTSALPSLNFVSDPDTGIYRIGADNFGLGVNGATEIDISTTRTAFSHKIQVPDASAANPSVYFASDTDTGIFLPAVGTLGLVAGGLSIVNITTSGMVLGGTGLTINGDLNVTGASSFGSQSFVNLSASGIATFSNNVTVLGNFTAGGTQADPGFIVLNDSDATKVGIGTSSPEDTLHVSGGNVLLDNNQYLGFKDSGGTARYALLLNSADDLSVGHTSYDELVLYAGSSGGISFFPGATNKVKFTSDGKVGIGTTIPSGNLHINATGTSDMLVLEDNDSTTTAATPYIRFKSTEGDIGYVGYGSGSNDEMYFDNSGGGDFVFQNGNVGIGTNTPESTLTVAGNGSFTGNLTVDGYLNVTGAAYIGTQNFVNLGASGNASFGGNLSVNNTLFVDSSLGRVGIGTSSPGTHLDVASTSGGNIYLRNTDTGITIGENIGSLNFTADDPSSPFTLAAITGIARDTFTSSNIPTDLAFSTMSNGTTALTEKMRLTYDGLLGIGTSDPNETLHISAIGSAGTQTILISADNDGGDDNADARIKLSGDDGDNYAFYQFENSLNNAEMGVGTGTGDHVGVLVYYAGSSVTNVAIGGDTIDTSPDANLEVVDDFMVSSSASGDGDLFIVQNSGNVGIGTTTPSDTLYVSGNATVTGNFSAGTGASPILRVDDATNRVGIGTTTPTQTLTVLGDLNVTGTTYLGTQNFASIDTSGNMTIGGNLSVDSGVLFVDNSVDRVGIGTSSPGTLLEVNSGTTVKSTSASILGLVGDASANIPQMDIIAQGDPVEVKIWANAWNTPGADYDALTINVTGNTDGGVQQSVGKIIFEMDPVNSNNGDGRIAFETASDGVLSEQMIIDENGKVGIGTSSPAVELEVYNASNSEISVYTDSGSDSSLFLGETATVGAKLVYDGGDNKLHFNLQSPTSATVMTMDRANGRIGINTTTPTQTLTVLGDLNVTGTTYLGTQNFASIDTSGNMTIGGNLSVDSGVLFVDNSVDRVGIGNKTPYEPLVVTPSGNDAIGFGNSGVGVSDSGGQAVIVWPHGDRYFGVADGAIGNTVRFRVDMAGGDSYVNTGGNFGIGETTPNDILEINVPNTFGGLTLNGTGSDSDIPQIRLLADRASDGGNAGQIRWYNNGATEIANIQVTRGSTDLKGEMSLRVSNSNALYIDEDGKVGIGTTSPASTLEVKAASAKIIINTTSGNPELEFNDGGTDEFAIYYDTGSNYFAFNEGGVGTQMVIEDGGNVGIGTTTPESLLHVGGIDGNVTIDTNLSVGGLLTVGTFSPTDMIISNNLTVAKNATVKGNFTAGGTRADPGFIVLNDSDATKVGIGTSSPSNPLYVLHATEDVIAIFESQDNGINVGIKDDDREWRFGIGGTRFLIEDETGGNLIPFSIEANTPSDTLYLDSTGNIGIGTTSPLQTLEVVGSLNVTGNATFGSNVSLVSGAEALPSLTFGEVTTGIYSAASGTIDITSSGTRSHAFSSGRYRGPSGTDALPGIAFLSDEDVGIYRPSADTLGLVAGGLSIVNITTSGMTLGGTGLTINGDLNVTGASSFGSQSFVNLSASGIATFSNNVTVLGNFTAGGTRADPGFIVLNDSDTTSVGIGTSGPTSELHVLSAGGTEILTESTAASQIPRFSIKDVDNGQWNLEVGRGSLSGLGFYETGDTTHMFLETGGFLGIGTTNPENLLHVKVNDAGLAPHVSANIVMEDTGTNYLQILTTSADTGGILFGDEADVDVGKVVYDHNLNDLQLWAGAAEVLTVDGATGNVGIGTTTPKDLLHVAGNVTIDQNLSVGGNLTLAAEQNLTLTSLVSCDTLDTDANGKVICGTDDGAGSITSFTLAGTSGTPQTITDGDTATIAAGTGITTTAAATDTVTIASTLGTDIQNAEVDDDLTIAGGIIGTSAITLSTTTDTASGRIAYDATNDRIVVGDGTTTDDFYSGAHTTDTSADTVCSGTTTYLDGEGGCDTADITAFDTEAEVEAAIYDNDNTLAGPWTVAGSSTNDINFDSNTFVVDVSTDRVGIGTASPGVGLHVKDASSNAYIEIEGATNSQAGLLMYGDRDWVIVNDGAGSTTCTDCLGIYDNDALSTRLTIDTAGKVGIGTTGPDRKLDVLDASNPQLRLTYTDGSVYTDLQTDSSGYLGISPSGGRVGIGTASPVGNLDIGGPGISAAGETHQVWIGDSGASSSESSRLGIIGYAVSGSTFVSSLSFHQPFGNTEGEDQIAAIWVNTGASSDDGDMLFLTTENGNLGTKMWLTQEGYLGIGASPQNYLDVEGAAVIGASYSGTSTAPSNGLLVEGDVGIGTSGPDRNLDVLDASNPQLRLTQADGTVYADFQMDSNGDLVIGVDGQTNQLVLDNGGAVGIGDASITSGATFQVAGSIGTSSDATESDVTLIYHDGTDARIGWTTGDFILDTSGITDPFVFKATGELGIGTDAPDSDLHIHNSAGSNPQISLTDGDVAHGMTTNIPTDTIGRLGSWSSLVGGLFISGYSDDSSAGGVLIRGVSGGTPTTQSAVEFRSGKKSGTTYTSLSSTDTAFSFENVDGTTTYMEIDGSGNIGIGQSDPTEALHINQGGKILLERSSDGAPTGKIYSNDGIRIELTSSTDDFRIYTGTGPTERFTIDPQGDVGIGDATPDTKLDVAGLTSSAAGRYICSDSDGSFYYTTGTCTSGLHLKENITSYLKGLDTIMQFESKQFNLKDGGDHQAGMVAEYIEPIAPECVMIGEDGTRGLNYDCITAIQNNAIQELKAENDAIKEVLCLDHPEAEIC